MVLKSFRRECESEISNFPDFLGNLIEKKDKLPNMFLENLIKFKLSQKKHLKILEKLMQKLGIITKKEEADYQKRRRIVKEAFFGKKKKNSC